MIAHQRGLSPFYFDLLTDFFVLYNIMRGNEAALCDSMYEVIVAQEL